MLRIAGDSHSAGRAAQSLRACRLLFYFFGRGTVRGARLRLRVPMSLVPRSLGHRLCRSSATHALQSR